uniref:F5/8 type C domain-containing protein n=1 Tax=Branchiostoma floridae TaxID=7739 RepID=C3ZFJ7_BRAFL|eukprot:XP_002592740.1 hypothetical protein BRAFLDRAFT_67180 [Branchiostoma floridae]
MATGLLLFVCLMLVEYVSLQTTEGSVECTSFESDLFRCKSSGTCVLPQEVCDGRNNCEDGSDELDCWSKECPLSSPFDVPFRCESSGACVGEWETCNGIYDCRDGSDERNCSARECPDPNDFRCESSGACVREWEKCNGIDDCSDGSDERDCSDGGCPNPGEFRCETSRRCVYEYYICNGDADCSDGSDEKDCLRKECPIPEDFKCRSGTCVRAPEVCNGVADCADGSDEEECSKRECPQFSSTDELFRCERGGACVPVLDMCDGVNDCADSSDESCWNDECPYPDFFTCESGEKTCVPPIKQCDHFNDCQDGSDEQCWNVVCRYRNDSRCQNDGVCIDQEQHCDGHPDCTDGSDEDCTVCPYPDDFRCQTGTCIRSVSHCDGHENCLDGSDEEDCWKKDCQSDSFNCKTSEKCVFGWDRCDGVVDCHHDGVRDESDESGCVCTSDKFLCENRCVAPVGVCDGVPDCDDSSDELLCPPCNGLQVECDGGCLPKYRACDGLEDCANGEDEINCTVGGCGSKQFPCADGTCLLESQLCDNRTDCSGGEDEEDCGDVIPPGFPLGLASRYIADVFITASSEYKPEFAASQARHTPPTAPGYCWVPSTVEDQWIQVYFGKTTNVTGVVIGGGGSNWDLGSWVTSFTLAFSMNGNEWAPYKGTGNDVQIFDGNRDRYNKVSRPLPVPVTSQYIRLYPTGYEGWVAMVMEVYVTNDENAWLVQGNDVPLGVGIDAGLDSSAAPKIPDLHFTASSRDGDFFPWLARLNNGRGLELGACWSPSLQDSGPWLQIKHDNVYEVAGVITQGAYNLERWVTSYKMSFSVNGETWTPYTLSTGDEKVFTGNSDNYRYARNMLDNTVHAFYTRFYPQPKPRIHFIFDALRVEILVIDEIDSQFMSCWDGTSPGRGAGVFHGFQACDGVEDCSTGRDEENCDDCGMECQTTLDSASCVPSSWICDEIEDCLDGEDEQGCVQGVPKHCFFTCRNDVTCLPTRLLGDGNQDCPDGEDERRSYVEDAMGGRWGSCSFNCSSVYGNASCVPDAFACDGDADCLGEEDEQSCEDIAPGDEGVPDVCLTFLCNMPGGATDQICVPPHWVCDGYPNCASGEDEQGCGNADSVSTQTSTAPSVGLQTAAGGQGETWGPTHGHGPQEESTTELSKGQGSPEDQTECIVSRLAYLKFVFCNHLKFETIPVDIPLNAERLEVSFNNIRNVTYIPALPLLSTLDLSYNAIEHMSWPALRVLPSLKYLLLGNNRLPQLKLDTVITHLPKLTYVDFSYNELVSVSPYEFGWPQVTNANINHNPYNCGCDMAWLIAKLACLESCEEEDKTCCSSCAACFLTEHHVKEYLKCETPRRLEGRLLSDVSHEISGCKKQGSRSVTQSKVVPITLQQTMSAFGPSSRKKTTAITVTTNATKDDDFPDGFRLGTDVYGANYNKKFIGNIAMTNTAPSSPKTIVISSPTDSLELLFITAMTLTISCITVMIIISCSLLYKVIMIRNADAIGEDNC